MPILSPRHKSGRNISSSLRYRITKQHAYGQAISESKYGIDINAVDSTRATPLLVAANDNCYVGVRYLIRKGAKMDAMDDLGETALHVATYFNWHGSIRLL